MKWPLMSLGMGDPKRKGSEYQDSTKRGSTAAGADAILGRGTVEVVKTKASMDDGAF